MKRKFTLLVTALFTVFALNAQVYNQGDINVSFITNSTHDSMQCISLGSLAYAITVQNSFTGDSVKVVEPSSGTVLFSAGNTTGQTPWSLTAPVAPNLQVFDEMVAGGFVSFSFSDTKVISGTDTIYNIYNTFQKPVNNPCIYDTAIGRMYFDNNSNCIYDAGDSTTDGLYVRYSFYATNPPTGFSRAGYLFTFNNSGYLRARYQKSWFAYADVFMDPALQFIFPLSPCATTSSYHITSLPYTGLDFPLQCSSNIDVQCCAAANGVIRPLIPFILHPVVNNTGCDMANGTLTLVLDSRVTYSAAQSTNPATTVTGNTLQWNYANLSSFSQGVYWNSFLAGVHLTPNGAVNIGDTLCFDVSATFQAGDVNQANNTYRLCLPVVNSYDPNIKEVEPKGTGVPGYIPGSTSELLYTVHFQNTGNAYAYNIHITDTLDSDIEPTSVRIVGASHSMQPEWLSSNVINFKFDFIYLADSFSNEPASHGFVQFKAKLKPSLTAGTQIKNQAAIYFDTNPPIFTNTALNTLSTNTAIDEVGIKNGEFGIYPNPASSSVTVTVDETLLGSTLTITDITGRELFRSVVSIQNSKFEIQNFSNGAYFVNISNGGQNITRKLLIQY